MTDRQYVKVNTSITTGSNASSLIHDEEGNVRAVIDLRLPEDTISRNESRGIQAIDMLPTKIRVSMSEAPIAQLPVDTELSNPNRTISTCQLDVYPYSILSDSTLKPTPNDPNDPTAFPYYKDHQTTYIFRIWTFPEDGDPENEVLEIVAGNRSEEGFRFPTENRFYNMMVKSDTLTQYGGHLMNLCPQSNHEKYKVEDGTMLVKSIATLEQMLQDALENAITFASTSDTCQAYIDLVFTDAYPESLTPTPDLTNTLTLAEYGGREVAFWKTETGGNRVYNDLLSAVKPTVKFTEQSLSISYDTAPFRSCPPIIWNPAFVNTYDTPVQMSLDQLRKEVWGQPPPKRVYQYGVQVGEEDDWNRKSYTFALPENITCALMNVIANEAFRNTFSFLPWVDVNTSSIPELRDNSRKYNVKVGKVNEGGIYQEIYYYDVTCKARTSGYFQTQFYNYPGADATQYGGSPYAIIYTFDIDPVDIMDDDYSSTSATIYKNLFEQQTGLTWWQKYPMTRRWNQTVDFGGDVQYREMQRNLDDDEQYMGTFEFPNGNGSGTINFFEEYQSNADNLQTGTTCKALSTVSQSAIRTKSLSAAVKPANMPVGYFNSNDPDDWRWGIPCAAGIGGDGRWTTNVSNANQWKTWLPPWEPDVPPIEEQSTTPGKKKVTIVWNKKNTTLDRQIFIAHGFRWSSDGEDEPAPVSTRTTYVSLKQETQVTRVSENPGVDVAKSLQVIPNLAMDNGHFYLLDGTNAEVSIGSQEVIHNLTDVQEGYKYKVSTTQTALSVLKTSAIKTEKTLVNKTYIMFPAIPNDWTISMYPFINNVRLARIQIRHNDETGEEEPWWLCGRNMVSPDSMTPQTVVTSWEYGTWSSQTPPSSETVVAYSNENLSPGTVVEEGTVDSEGTEGIIYTDPNQRDWQVAVELIIHEPDGTIYSERKWVPCKKLFPDLDIDEWDPGVIPGDNKYPEYKYNLIPDLDRSTAEVSHILINRDFGDYVPYTVYTWYLQNLTYSANGQYVEYQIQHTNYDNYTRSLVQTTTRTTRLLPEYLGNVRLTFTWPNLPVVIMSPIQSIVLVMDGVKVNNQIQPINMRQPGGSSLTTTIPIIENYYSTASSLRDLHDELVIIKDNFTNAPVIRVDPSFGSERTMRFRLQYITKDGNLHHLYIPNNGIFSLQISLCLYY